MHSSNRVYLNCCSTWSAAVFHLSLVAGSIPDAFVGECHKWKCEVMKEWTEDLLTSYWDQFGPSVGPVAPWADACTPVRYCACRFHFNIPCLLPKLTGMSRLLSYIFPCIWWKHRCLQTADDWGGTSRTSSIILGSCDNETFCLLKELIDWAEE